MQEITPEFLRPRLLRRQNDSHKHDYGRLLVIAGCETMPGAALLATGAALRSGCGLVMLHSTPRTLFAEAYSSRDLIDELPCGFYKLEHDAYADL